MSSLVITRAMLASGEIVDIEIDGDKITAVLQSESAAAREVAQVSSAQVSSAQVIDAAGMLVLPGFVNAHAHLDKTWWGQPWVRYGGVQSTEGRIQHERAERGRYGIPNLSSTTGLLSEMLRLGTTAIRSHADVDLGVGLGGIECISAAVQSLEIAPEVQIVAFAQDGVVRRPGVAKLLDEAAQLPTVSHIGAVDPATIDRDPVELFDTLIDIAVQREVGIDLHLHDGGELGAFQVELLAERTKAAGLQGRVTVSHGFFLGELDAGYRQELLDQIAEAGISWATASPADTAPLPWKEMRERAIPIGLGTDGIRDLWTPLGTGDPLAVAREFARLHRMRADADLEHAVWLAGAGAAELFARQARGIEAGALADLVFLKAENPSDALARTPERELVIVRGRVVTANGAG